MNIITLVLLRLMALLFNSRKKLNSYLKTRDGYLNFTAGFKTEDGTVNRAISFRDGKVTALKQSPENPEVLLRFRDRKTVLEMLSITPNEMLMLILNNRMILEGNIAFLQTFNFFISLLMSKTHRRKLRRVQQKEMKEKKKFALTSPSKKPENIPARKDRGLTAEPADKGVLFLDEPYLSRYSLENFPRLQWMLDRHFSVMPKVCPERPLLLTEWYRQNGFETRTDGTPWHPPLRQAEAFHHLMKNKKPIIAEKSLLAGTTTAKEPVGVVIYPDAQGTMLWGELKSTAQRSLNPYEISDEDAHILHHEIFPFWTSRNFREYVRKNFDYPDAMKIDERWVFYFVWKSVGISHTIPDYHSILTRGTRGIMKEIDERLTSLEPGDNDGRKNLEAMTISLHALEAFAANLSAEAKRSGAAENDPVRRDELLSIAKILEHVPANPARTLHEALQVLWIVWVALHMENTNTGLSLGRLDQLLQPYLVNDMKSLSSTDEREEYTRRAIELCGSFYMCCTDHLPLVPDIGNYLFGGSSSDQAITLGGTRPDGTDAVNDMTYILLKVTELLAIRDPNVNARFNKEVNSETYLKRLCEVNYTTAATPSMHNDLAVAEALSSGNYLPEDIRDWSATGCVEPTLSGKHMGHTGSILMNMVASLEMALNDGRHPHMSERFGPATGSIENDDFQSFDDFFDAWCSQQAFLIDSAVTLNNMYAKAHAVLRPTPFLSALIDGSIEKAKDVTAGGARYNSSGTSNIGLADVTDSLMVIKKLVFDEKIISFKELKKAIDADFSGYPEIEAIIARERSCFGSGDPGAIEMANRITSFVHGIYRHKINFRGGAYTAGFWSMSQHVAYGNLSGTLPSGRRSGRAFTPGLTPSPWASQSFLDNIRDVACLAPENMDNNIAFNVKLVPEAGEKREDIVNTMVSYVKTYFDLRGMQMQFNVVNSTTLRDAMANPEKYRNLLVRISGYNAYFVTLNREMQLELIERAEYGL